MEVRKQNKTKQKNIVILFRHKEVGFLWVKGHFTLFSYIFHHQSTTMELYYGVVLYYRAANAERQHRSHWIDRCHLPSVADHEDFYILIKNDMVEIQKCIKSPLGNF